jgi:ATP-dependent Clp protease ATP-binding subunit ClpA
MTLRTTFECREALRWANRLAHDLGQESVDLPHLLDGLVMTEGGHAANILEHLLRDTRPLRSELWALLPAGLTESDHLAEVPSLRQTVSFKRVIEGALSLAERSESWRITSGHILAALCEQAGEPAAEVVRRCGVTAEVVQDHAWLPWEA